MSRSFKSAAFPILIVLVLAFLAVKLVSPSSSNHRSHSYQTLVAKEIPQGEVKSVNFKNKGKALEVKLKDGQEKYEIGLHRTGDARTDQGTRAAGVEASTSNRKRAACCCRC